MVTELPSLDGAISRQVLVAVVVFEPLRSGLTKRSRPSLCVTRDLDQGPDAVGEDNLAARQYIEFTICELCQQVAQFG